MKYVCTAAGRYVDGTGAWLLLHDWEADFSRLKKEAAFHNVPI